MPGTADIFIVHLSWEMSGGYGPRLGDLNEMPSFKVVKFGSGGFPRRNLLYCLDSR